ncbi:alpha-L-fucosidase [Yeosuana sp. MJ-SS3]|uniref:alpha-L-fucosidase n=1 Tax=Gilvirhabdus luticola TaxID=3079858 RepID=A0ABU3U9A0_9FLAO|nr:alpha-L-fucosidase [Yeosuana sp. MJ-SS3]MDU8886982.1 alpha-L-fucosidase [Yeosuana sp. MJ-SS3]
MNNILGLMVVWLLCSCNNIQPPKPFGPLPSKNQLEWHKMEHYAFIHFNMNTFTNMEWGFGNESPRQFNPTNLDASQWAKTIKDAGMKGVIITAKHHDGFCLWPSKYTEHSVKNSPWKNGKGDVLKDLSEACKEYGLKMGVYLSPWDRNHADYGKPEYIEYFQNQLRELLTNYGDIFEVWFDGANGGTGYYGGTNETRKIDNKTYYQWDKVAEIVEELQPNAVIFGDGGPGVRWVGNEEGWANETNWSLIRKDEVFPGYDKYTELRSGHENGTHWVPAECDVSIRPGWYYHPAEDNKVKSLSHLVKIYYESVGRNASLLLNLPVDHRGLIHEKDIEQVMALKQQLDKDFANNLTKNVSIVASQVRGNSTIYDASNLVDEDENTYWATNDNVTDANVTIEFPEPREFNRFLVQEYIPLGQRIKKFSIEVEINGQWKTIDTQSTIGYKRILKFKPIVASKLRFHVLESKACIAISNIEIYNAPIIVEPPVIVRNKEGLVSISNTEEESTIFYSTNGIDPNIESSVFKENFFVKTPTTIKAITYDYKTNRLSEIIEKRFDISKGLWTVLNDQNMKESIKAIDNDSNTNCNIMSTTGSPELIVDLGKQELITGFTYTPDQGRFVKGVITDYSFFISSDKVKWRLIKTDEFSNIINNPIKQMIKFNSSVNGQFVKLVANSIMNNEANAVVAEFGVLTQ